MIMPFFKITSQLLFFQINGALLNNSLSRSVEIPPGVQVCPEGEPFPHWAGIRGTSSNDVTVQMPCYHFLLRSHCNRALAWLFSYKDLKISCY